MKAKALFFPTQREKGISSVRRGGQSKGGSPVLALEGRLKEREPPLGIVWITVTSRQSVIPAAYRI